MAVLLVLFCAVLPQTISAIQKEKGAHGAGLTQTIPIRVLASHKTGSTLAQTASAVTEMVRVGLSQVTWAGVQEATHAKGIVTVQVAVHSFVALSVQPVGPPLTSDA